MRIPLLIASALCATAACAQTALYVQQGGQFHLVRQAVNHDPYVIDDAGKLVWAKSNAFTLRPTEQFLPAYVSIHHLTLGTSALQTVDTGTELNRDLLFSGEFESLYGLKHVYVALEMRDGGRFVSVFLQGLGDLAPHQLKAIHERIPLDDRFTHPSYVTHVYSDGLEVFTSAVPPLLIEHKLDELVAQKTSGMRDSAPRPFIGPAPTYPASLRKQHVRGSALIAFHISATGRVSELVVKSASRPEFGEAAITAARQWRFLPRMKDGKPMPSSAVMPFEFDGASLDANSDRDSPR